jgi:glycosyltransferase involved in cell wall biosynthesis
LLELEAQKLARYEATVCNRFEEVVWVTHEDYDAVRTQVTDPAAALRNSGVIPICTEACPEHRIQRSANPRRVTFLGGLHYPPNAEGVMWFAQAVWPTVLAAVPDAILTVIGKQPPAGLNQLGIPAANLEVTGYVADPLPYLAETAAFIVPLQAGGGMRVKILDAWKWGAPIVSTTIGAEGIAVTPGHDILLADHAAGFAAATIDLLQHHPTGQALSAAGQATLQRCYDWRTVYRQWDAIYPN